MIVWAIKRYRPFLEDRPFILKTDSKSLTWLKSQRDTRAKLTWWHLLLSEFSFTIEHVAGKENELPDALSRFPDPNEPSPGEPSIERMIPPNLSLITKNVKTSVPTLIAIYAPRLFEEIVFTQQEDPLISRDAIRLR